MCPACSLLAAVFLDVPSCPSSRFQPDVCRCVEIQRTVEPGRQLPELAVSNWHVRILCFRAHTTMNPTDDFMRKVLGTCRNQVSRPPYFPSLAACISTSQALCKAGKTMLFPPAWSELREEWPCVRGRVFRPVGHTVRPASSISASCTFSPFSLANASADALFIWYDSVRRACAGCLLCCLHCTYTEYSTWLCCNDG